MENPFKMDDLGVPLFLETPKSKLSKHAFYLAISSLWLTSEVWEDRRHQEILAAPEYTPLEEYSCISEDYLEIP